MISQELEQKIQNYQPSKDAVALLKTTPVLLLVGIFCAGKDTITQGLLDTKKYHLIVSHTTRVPRSNQGVMERNDMDYHFVDHAMAEKMVDDHAFIEVKLKLYSDDIYGTSVAEIQKAHDDGKIAITDVDVHGSEEYIKLASNTKVVFILPPSYDVWQQRIKKRLGDSVIDSDDLTKRMRATATELDFALRADYMHFVVNDDLEQAVLDVDAIAAGGPEMLSRAEAHELIWRLLARMHVAASAEEEG